MINHVRTLILNRTSRGDEFKQSLGGEYIPPGFTAQELPAALRSVYRLLFGLSPDWFYANYRIQQYMALLHATELSEYVFWFDDRISYDVKRPSFFSPGIYVPRVSNESMRVTGEFLPPDSLGNSIRRWKIIVSSTTVDIFSTTPPLNQSVTQLKDVIRDTSFLKISLLNIAALSQAFLGGKIISSTPFLGVSQPIELVTDSALIEVPINAGTYWLDVYVKPAKSLGQLTLELAKPHSVAIRELFGTADQEPMKTFLALWLDHPELAYKLGGLLLAFAFRAEELRIRHA